MNIRVAGARGIFLLSLLSGIGAMGTEAVPATRPTPVLDQDRIRRGQEIRQILLDTIDQKYANNGIWPEHPAASNGRHLVYIRPEPDVPHISTEALRQAAESGATTVVLHESFEEYPFGVWVGYEDAHLEFAASAEEFAACKEQRQWDRRPSNAGTQPAPTGDAPLMLKLVGPSGEPVAGAAVGVFVQFSPDQKGSPIIPLHEGDKGPPVSDKQGELLLKRSGVFQYKFSEQPITPIYILAPNRQLVGTVDLRPDDFGPGKKRTVQLLPPCHVHGQLSSLGLAAAGKKLDWANTLLFQPGQESMYTMNFISNSADFDFYLLPGVYGIDSYGRTCNHVYRYFRIEAGQRQMTLQLDLPANAIFQLLGRPAPEFKSIKGWKNGDPVKLAELHGRVVLLDFWGYWCGPCVASVPPLMKLHDEFKDKGLVIIAVHDDTAESIAEMDQKLTEDRKTVWGGRDLPFLIALDGGGPTRIKYSGGVRQGATNAEYGINSYPTSLLIGRDGNVIGEINVRGSDARSQVQKAIDEK